MNWIKEFKKGDYTLWRHKTGGHYQVTKNDQPPQTEGGYGSAQALLRLKGVI